MTIASDSSAYLGDALLNWISGTVGGWATVPPALYVGLYGTPDALTGAELTGTVAAYTLVSQNAKTHFAAVASNAMSTNADLSFGTVTGSPANVFAVGISDATSASHNSGNQLCWKGISSTPLSAGLVVKILSGNLTLSY
jgi:hypothetical protein